MPIAARRACSLCAALGLALLLAAPAWAHGGRFRGPVRPPIRGPAVKRPPGAPPRPLTPGAPVPAVTTPAPGSGIPTIAGNLPDAHWGTWWALNAWAYLPERGAALRKHRVITGSDDADMRAKAARARRALLATHHIKPYLLKHLDPKAEPNDGVRAAALLALAKVANDAPTLERVLRLAEGGGTGWIERESAALAIGLLRRTEPAARLSPIQLERARTRLLAIVKAPQQGRRGRCFAAFSLGLLADQGYATDATADGRMVVKGLIEHLSSSSRDPEIGVAVLTSLAMQPRAGVPIALYDSLRDIVHGKKAYGRRWSDLERSHALSTYARLQGPAWVSLLLRSLLDRRVPMAVQRSARLTLGSQAPHLSADERGQAARALLNLKRRQSDPSGDGVAQIALGRILNAELRSGSSALLRDTRIASVLLRDAMETRVSIRGFYVLALALSAREVQSTDADIGAFVTSARKTLIRGFDRPKGDAGVQSAYAVGIGLIKAKEAKARLVDVLRNVNGGLQLRGASALAAASIEAADKVVLDTLRTIAADTSPMAPRSQAALALSLLTGVPTSDLLVEQLRSARSLRQQTSAAFALGQLDDPKALSAIIELASKRKESEEVRALAMAVLGLLGDPEEAPSLFRLTLDANYIARTDALNEAFTLL